MKQTLVEKEQDKDTSLSNKVMKRNRLLWSISSIALG